MGVSANQARLMTLTARLHDLELRAQKISAMKMIKSMESQKFASKYSEDLNSATTGTGGFDTSKINNASYTYQSAMTSLSNAEKLLDFELTQINTEHEAAKTEYDGIKSLISENVDKSFNIFG